MTCSAVIQTGEMVAVGHLGKIGETFSILTCMIAVSTELKPAPGRQLTEVQLGQCLMSVSSGCDGTGEGSGWSTLKKD